MIAAILIGRKGSKGFPGKNTQGVLGHPLAYYPIRAALDCPKVDEVFMSTDDERLMALARDNGVTIIERPQELCTDQALGEDVYLQVYRELKVRHMDIEILVLLMCNAPAVTPEILTQGIDALRKNPDYDSAITVSRYNMWSPLRARKIGKDGLLHPFVDLGALEDSHKLNCDRDSQGDVWFADMGASIIRPRNLEHLDDGLLPQKWMGRKIYPLKQWGGLDVDYEWQLPQVEFWLKEKGKA